MPTFPMIVAWDVWVARALATTVVGLAVGSLVMGRNAAPAARVTREGGTIFLGEAAMNRAYALLAPLVRAAVATRVPPDAISWGAFVLGLGAGGAAAAGCFGVAAWLLALSGAGDLLDGAVARATGQATPAGAALDSALDRYVEFFFYAGLIVRFRGEVAWQLAVAAGLFGGMMVTYTTAKGEALGVALPRGWMKRAERMVWLIVGATVAGATGRPAVMAAVVAVIALAGNLSAVLRLRALTAAARR